MAYHFKAGIRDLHPRSRRNDPAMKRIETVDIDVINYLCVASYTGYQDDIFPRESFRFKLIDNGFDRVQDSEIAAADTPGVCRFRAGIFQSMAFLTLSSSSSRLKLLPSYFNMAAFG